MVQRRSFLQGGLFSALALGLEACSAQPPVLRVKLLSQSVPIQVVSTFQQSLDPSIAIKFSSAANLQQLFELLQHWNAPTPPARLWFMKSPPLADLVTLGDAWLKDAIQQQLIQPWNPEGWQGWQNLSDRFRALGQRNDRGLPDPQGHIWGLPYRWGTTAMAYRREDFHNWGWTPTDWSDLWRSELRGKIGLPESAREVMGLTLKSLGQSYNTLKPDEVPGFPEKLRALQKQVKFYSSTHLVQPLLVKDVSLIVGWSTDLLPLMSLDREIEVIVPQSGTALWADLWVRPRNAPATDLQTLERWIEFCWQPKMAALFSEFGHGTSPQASPVAHQPVLFPPAAVFDRSEFIVPLPSDSLDRYRQLWQQMRSVSPI